MKVSDFAVLICDMEDGKSEVNIAQMKQVLKCINKATNGEFYKLVRSIA